MIEILWMLVKSFLVGGLLCAIGQVLIMKTQLTSARILVGYVTAGVILGALGLYKPIVDFAGAGATVPLLGFGYALARGAIEGVKETGILGAFTGGVDFSDMKLYLPLGAGDSAIAYGSFINAVIQFVIIAFVVFLMVKALNKARSLAKHGKQAQEKEAPHCPYCLEEVAEGATRCPHCTAELPEPAGFTAKA